MEVRMNEFDFGRPLLGSMVRDYADCRIDFVAKQSKQTKT